MSDYIRLLEGRVEELSDKCSLLTEKLEISKQKQAGKLIKVSFISISYVELYQIFEYGGRYKGTFNPNTFDLDYVISDIFLLIRQMLHDHPDDPIIKIEISLYKRCVEENNECWNLKYVKANDGTWWVAEATSKYTKLIPAKHVDWDSFEVYK